MPDTKAQRDWVERVLGVHLDTKSSATQRRPLLPIWLRAKEDADAAITKLQNVLRARNDDDLHTIVEFGLHGATTGQAVKLMAALRDADAKGTPEAFARVREAVDDFSDFLNGAPIVDLLEDNPFGVSVPLRATLGPALDELKRQAA